MVLRKEIVKKNIVINNSDFDIDKIYKKVKEKAESMGYFFIEKEQGLRSGKYGGEVRFRFYLGREVDYFGSLEFDLDLDFNELSKVKNLDHGNCKVTIKGTVTFDSKNKWGMTRFNKFLLGLYLKVADPMMKKNYLIPLIKEGNELHDFIKEQFE